MNHGRQQRKHRMGGQKNHRSGRQKKILKAQWWECWMRGKAQEFQAQ